MSAPEKIAGHEIHPAASVLPLMSEAELAELAEDIRRNGLRHPIVCLRPSGVVIDGRNRLLACERAGVEPIFDHLPIAENDVAPFVASTNIARRHLTPSQKAMLAVELIPFFSKEAKERQKKHGGTAPGKKGSAPGREVSLGEAVREFAEDQEPSTAAARAGRSVAASERSVERAKFVAEKSPELAEKVKRGEATLKEAERQLRGQPARKSDRQEGSSEDPNQRFTPRTLIERLHREHHFTVDAASCPESPAAQVIGRIWTVEDDGLEESWRGERVFCNPPFDEIEAWVEKAHRSVNAEGCPLVVMLLPAVRTDQAWWHKYVEHYRDREGSNLRTQFLEGRTRFGFPNDPEGKDSGSPPFGCVLLTWRGAEASPAKETPPVDKGNLCGVYDGKKGDPCFLELAHDGAHRNGRRTWPNKPPKAEPAVPVMALSEFRRWAKENGFKIEPLPGKTKIEISCVKKGCLQPGLISTEKLTAHLDVPRELVGSLGEAHPHSVQLKVKRAAKK